MKLAGKARDRFLRILRTMERVLIFLFSMVETLESFKHE